MVAATVEKRFRYTWSRTWDYKREDYVCDDLGVRSAGSTGLAASRRLVLAMYALIGNRSGSSSGRVETLDDACHAVERVYEELIARTPSPKKQPACMRPVRAILFALKSAQSGLASRQCLFQVNQRFKRSDDGKALLA